MGSHEIAVFDLACSWHSVGTPQDHPPVGTLQQLSLKITLHLTYVVMEHVLGGANHRPLLGL